MKTPTKQRHATFQAFSEIIDIIVNTDEVHRGHLPELYNDWFELYKGMNYPDVIEWAKFQFTEVTPRYT